MKNVVIHFHYSEKEKKKSCKRFALYIGLVSAYTPLIKIGLGIYDSNGKLRDRLENNYSNISIYFSSLFFLLSCILCCRREQMVK